MSNVLISCCLRSHIYIEYVQHLSPYRTPLIPKTFHSFRLTFDVYRQGARNNVHWVPLMPVHRFFPFSDKITAKSDENQSISIPYSLYVFEISYDLTGPCILAIYFLYLESIDLLLYKCHHSNTPCAYENIVFARVVSEASTKILTSDSV